MNLKDVTIAFSGFNMRHFAILAVESFLLQYPELRGNVIYFDDESTDRTREDLERRGIKVITWTDKWKKELLKYKEMNFFTSTTQVMSSRVCFIMREIMEQTNTKYLLISDGDVVFKKGNFIEKYMKEFEKGSKIVFHEENSIYDGGHRDECRQINEEYFKYYSRFEIPFDVSKHETNFTKEELRCGIFSSLRVHLLHTIIDLEYFKSIDMLGDRLNLQTFTLMHGGLVDTGTDFYHQIRDAKIPYSVISHDEVENLLLHWGWISSSNRDIDKLNQNSRRNQVEEITKQLNKRDIAEILNKTNLKASVIIKSYSMAQEKKQLF